MNTILTLQSVNGSPVVQYRDIDEAPVPYKVAILRRTLTPDGHPYRDGGSEWKLCDVADIVAQVSLNGPVCHWLETATRVDTSRLHSYPPDAPAYLWNVNTPRDWRLTALPASNDVSRGLNELSEEKAGKGV